MVLLNKDKKSIRSIITACRILLAVVMMLSGFLKAADPVGTMYKLKEYTANRKWNAKIQKQKPQQD